MKQRLWVIIKSMWVTLFINSLYLYLSGLSLKITKHVAKVSITNEFLPKCTNAQTHTNTKAHCLSPDMMYYFHLIWTMLALIREVTAIFHEETKFNFAL